MFVPPAHGLSSVCIEILKLHSAISKLDSHFEIGMVSNYVISDLHGAILKFREIANCAEHIYLDHNHAVMVHCSRIKQLALNTGWIPPNSLLPPKQ